MAIFNDCVVVELFENFAFIYEIIVFIIFRKIRVKLFGDSMIILRKILSEKNGSNKTRARKYKVNDLKSVIFID